MGHNFQFNFVGRLLGPRGLTLQRLQADTRTKMTVLGRGSMRDKQKVRVSVTLPTTPHYTSFSFSFKSKLCSTFPFLPNLT